MKNEKKMFHLSKPSGKGTRRGVPMSRYFNQYQFIYH